MDSITITVLNWDKYTKRNADYVQPWWFSCNNRILEDADIYDLDDKEFRAWIYVLSQASLKKSGTVAISFDHAERVCKVSKKSLLSLINKFSTKSILSESGHGLASKSPASGGNLVDTIQTNNTNNRRSGQGPSEYIFTEEFKILAKEYITGKPGPGAEKRFREHIKTHKDLTDFKQAYKNYLEDQKSNLWRQPKGTLVSFLGTKEKPYWRDYIHLNPVIPFVDKNSNEYNQIVAD